MAFYAGRAILEPRMENPTIVVITDRNDLDDQLFGTFARCHDLLRQSPVQAESRDDLRVTGPRLRDHPWDGKTRGAESLCQAASVAQVRASATMHR